MLDFDNGRSSFVRIALPSSIAVFNFAKSTLVVVKLLKCDIESNYADEVVAFIGPTKDYLFVLERLA